MALLIVDLIWWFHAVLYNYYDSDHDGMISQSEVADAMRVASGEDLSNSQLEKVKFSWLCPWLRLHLHDPKTMLLSVADLLIQLVNCVFSPLICPFEPRCNYTLVSSSEIWAEELEIVRMNGFSDAACAFDNGDFWRGQRRILELQGVLLPNAERRIAIQLMNRVDNEITCFT